MSHNGCCGEPERLLDYAAGGLDAASRAEVERHLDECGRCRDLLAGQRAVWADLDAWEAPAVSADFDHRLYARISRETSWWDRIARLLFGPALGRRGLPVAAAAGLALVAILVMSHQAPVLPAPPVAAQQVEPLRPDQVETAVQDVEMLREFNGLVQPDPAM